MIHYGREFRTIRADDIESAKRGLRMWHKSNSELLDMKECHEKIDAFASAVICQAISEVLADRRMS